MSKQNKVALRLVARQSTEGEGWLVEVAKNGVVVKRDVPVRDPLDSDQRSTCRWYLEKYVRSLPFSLDRAREAELLLERYPEDLLRQLSLRHILASDFEDAPYSLDSILLSIEVCHNSADGGCSVDTIHRLFWELLENPDLWGHTRLAIVVERSVSSPTENYQQSHPDRFDCWKQPDGTLTLNVLVVVARDMTQASSMGEEVNPFLATDTLIKVQKMLANTSSPVQIRLEIVRPGTFAAFEDHLERARKIHGEHGYFHLVHFDMHGTIVTRKGKQKKYGMLSFSDPKSDGFWSVPGRTVAQVLEKYKIPFVVLNACESANATLGDDANIAQQFLKHGVKGVLGMSFQIAASAAAMFLQAFYDALLIRGGSFSEAAAVGRGTLRMNPTRPARHQRQQQCQDSFVAITYGSGLRCVLVPSNEPILHPSMATAIKSVSPSTQVMEGLYGRDMALLRLEKQLLQTYAVYLHGMAGVGKSLFLKRAISLWKSTNFVDAVVAIDFSKDSITSCGDLSRAILRQLLSQVKAPDHRFILSHSLQSYDNAMIDAIVAEILLGIESILIFDSLDIHLTRHPSHLVAPLSESATVELCRFMESLVTLSQNPTSREQKTRLIFSARRGDAQWLETQISRPFVPLLYELEGLDVASAIDLSYQVLQKCGEDTQQWAYEDIDHLVSIVQLLGCNPSALISVLPLQRALKIEWRHFYQRLHHGLFESEADLKQVDFGASRFAQEIRHASINLLRGNFFFICILAIFWDVANTEATLQIMFSTTANVSLRQDFPMVGCFEPSNPWCLAWLSFAMDRGYVRIDNDKTCFRVHPLLTIVGRAYLAAFLTPAKRIKLRTIFGFALESLHCLFVEQKQDFRIGFANMVSSINFCLTDIPVNDWPLRLIIALSSPALLSALPLTTRLMPEEQMFKVLRLLSAKFGEVVEKERYMQFFVLVLVHIVSTLENSRQTSEHVFELSSIGFRLLASLDHQNLTLDTYVYQDGLLLVQLFALPLEQHPSGGQKSWPALMALKDELCEKLDQTGSPLPNLERLNLLSAVMDDFRTMTSVIQNTQYPDTKLPDIHDLVCAISLLLSGMCNAELLATGARSTEKCQQRTMIPKEHAIVEKLLEQSREISVSQYKRMFGFNARNLQTIPVAMTKAEIKLNKALETSYNTGEWIKSLELHETMITGAVDGYRFEEAEQHIDSMRAILTKVSAPIDIFNALEVKKRTLDEKHKKYLGLYCLTQSRMGDSGDTSENARPKNASKQPKSFPKIQLPSPASQAATMDRNKCKEFPRTWWQMCESNSSPESAWVAQVYDNPAKYGEEARLLNGAHGAWMTGDVTEVWSLLQRLDTLCRDGMFTDYASHATPLQRIREFLETNLRQSQITQDLKLAYATHDLKSVKTLLKDLGDSAALKAAPITLSDVDFLYVQNDRDLLLKFTYEFHAASEAGQWNSCQKLYSWFLELVNKGELSRIDAEEIVITKTQVLGILMNQAAKRKQWNDSISYCDENLVLLKQFRSNGLRKFDLERQDACLELRFTCELGRAEGDLTAAEAGSDYDKCLELVDVLENLLKVQKATPGRARSFFFLVGPKHLEFWRGSYRDGCLDCARWSRQRIPSDCMFPQGKGPNHDRSVFRASAHRSVDCHCEGGYCQSC